MVELTETDFEILKFINENEPVELSKIRAEFPSISSLEYRISRLKSRDYQGNATILVPIQNTSYILEKYNEETDKALGIYFTTDMGKKALQDHERQSKAAKRELWLKNAWIPILVTLATNLVIGALKWLWPLIQRWASSFL
ncbi:MAG: hypothetical protein ACQGTM_15625 [bacterium]